MGKVYGEIGEAQRELIAAQKMFFVATAPLAGEGHINLSPKGLDSFRILDANTVAYLDLTGSGAETIAHLRENGRIVIMFCTFEGAPKILRLYGRGEVVTPGSSEFVSLAALFPPMDGVRSVIRIHVERVADSCGYSVPRMKFEAERTQLLDWAARKGDGLREYRRNNNARSIDGLPALSDEE